jgi:hypothetical protein
LKLMVIGATNRLLPLVRLVPGVLDAHFALSNDSTFEADAFVLDQGEPGHLEGIIKALYGKRILMVFSARHGFEHKEYKAIHELCQDYQIPIITDIADGQVSQELERLLFPHRLLGLPQAAVALVGCHRKAGVKAMAAAITDSIQERIVGTIGWVDMNPYAFCQQIHNKSHWGNLYREYESGVLSPTRIRELAIRQASGVYVIQGNPRLESARLFKPQLLEPMLRMVMQTFNWTLFTLHPYWDNSMTLVPLSMMLQKLWVATSKREEMEEFYSVRPQLQFATHLDLDKHPFIYNMDGLGNETNPLVAAKLESESIATVPYLPRLPNSDGHELKEILSPLAKQWVKEFSLQQKPSAKKSSTGIYSWFRK